MTELKVGNADRSDDLRFGEKIQGLLLLRSPLAFECHTVVTGSLAGNCPSDSSDQSFTAIAFRDHFGRGDSLHHAPVHIRKKEGGEDR